jgi:hypothetical protein
VRTRSQGLISRKTRQVLADPPAKNSLKLPATLL